MTMKKINFGLLDKRDGHINNGSASSHYCGMGSRVIKLEECAIDTRERFTDTRERLTRIEEFAVNTRDRLTRIETRLEQTATRTEIHKEINTLTWRLMRSVCGFGTALVAATYFVVAHMR